MKRAIFVVCAACCIFTSSASAFDLVIYVASDDNSIVVTDVLPQLSRTDSNDVINMSQQSDKWLARIDFASEIVIPISIQISGSLPDGFEFEPLMMEAPFFEKNNTLTFVITPVPNDNAGDPAHVRELWNTNVQKLSDENLPRFYQTARVVARARMDQMNEQWQNLHLYDVRAVYKYLEAVTVLSKSLYVVPPLSVSQARDWFETAITSNPKVTNKAVGEANAEQLLALVDGAEGARFTQLWRSLVDLDCTERFVLLKAYRSLFSQIPTKTRRENVEKVTQVPQVEVEKSLNQCVADQAKRQRVSVEQSLRDLSEQIETLRAIAEPAKAEAIADDLVYLEQVRQQVCARATEPNLQSGCLPPQ